jgi:hypothetical protein
LEPLLTDRANLRLRQCLTTGRQPTAGVLPQHQATAIANTTTAKGAPTDPLTGNKQASNFYTKMETNI